MVQTVLSNHLKSKVLVKLFKEPQSNVLVSFELQSSHHPHIHIELFLPDYGQWHAFSRCNPSL